MAVETLTNPSDFAQFQPEMPPPSNRTDNMPPTNFSQPCPGPFLNIPTLATTTNWPLSPSTTQKGLPATPVLALSSTSLPTTVDSEKIEGADHPLAQLSEKRKWLLLVVFCVSAFVDICNASGVGIAVAQISADIKLGVTQMVWIMTAYSLTFASFVLFAGRLSDLFSAQVVFQVGFAGLGISTLAMGFVTNNKYGFLILRGIGGMFGAMIVPSANSLIVHMYPDPTIKRKRLALISVSGAFGNVMGLVLAGVMMLKSYHWFFRFMAIVCLAFSFLTVLFLPNTRTPRVPDGIPFWRKLDIMGAVLMCGALVCFILSLTQGPIDGWHSLAFVVPFVLSIILVQLFFVWEAWISPKVALLPVTTWKVTNMGVMSLVILVPFSFWTTSQLLYATYWQRVFDWKPLHVAVAVLPQGIATLIAGGFTQAVPVFIQKPRVVIPMGAARVKPVSVVMISEVLMYYSNAGNGVDYWRFVFPAFVMGSFGAIAMYMAATVNLIAFCPPEMAGVGSAWNKVLAEVGSSIALAVQAGLEGDDFLDWRSNARSFWFQFITFGVVAIAYVAFYKTPGTFQEEHDAARARIEELEWRLGAKKERDVEKAAV